MNMLLLSDRSLALSQYRTRENLFHIYEYTISHFSSATETKIRPYSCRKGGHLGHHFKNHTKFALLHSSSTLMAKRIVVRLQLAKLELDHLDE